MRHEFKTLRGRIVKSTNSDKLAIQLWQELRTKSIVWYTDTTVKAH